MFLLGFATVMAANSFGVIPDAWASSLSGASRFCLITAVAALGVKTSLRNLVEVGPKPIAALVLQTLWLAAFATAAVFFGADFLPR